MSKRLGLAALSAVLMLVACTSDGADDETDATSTTTTTAATTTSTSATAVASTTLAKTTSTTAPTTPTAAPTTAAAIPAVALEGDWFACEFVDPPGSEPSDDCKWFDDDGLRFAAGGELSIIELAGGEEENCLHGNPGACFSSDLADVELAVEPLGTWTLSGTVVSVTVGSCEGTLGWEPGEAYSFFRQGDADGCEVLWIDSNAFDQAQVGGVFFGHYTAGT